MATSRTSLCLCWPFLRLRVPYMCSVIAPSVVIGKITLQSLMFQTGSFNFSITSAILPMVCVIIHQSLMVLDESFFKVKERPFPHSNHFMLYNAQLALPDVLCNEGYYCILYGHSVTPKKMTGKEHGEMECKEDK